MFASSYMQLETLLLLLSVTYVGVKLDCWLKADRSSSCRMLVQVRLCAGEAAAVHVLMQRQLYLRRHVLMYSPANTACARNTVRRLHLTWLLVPALLLMHVLNMWANAQRRCCMDAAQRLALAPASIPCFMSQPDRSGLCQNSIPSLSGFLALNKLAMACCSCTDDA